MVAALAALAALGAGCGAGKGAAASRALDAAVVAGPVDASVADARAAAAAPPERAGCGDARLLVAPDDPAAPGPWPVGTRTLTLAGLRAEVWYPARRDSAANVPLATYDLAEELPAAEAARLRAAGVTLPPVPCVCYRDLPIDDEHGPYPLVLYVHGLTLFRFASVTMTAHWASRGFVVVAADFPGADLADVLSGKPRASIGDVAADAAHVLDAAAALFPGRVDATHVGLTGHSLGADVASELAQTRGDVVIALAERGVAPAAGRRFFTLVMGGTDDRVEPHVRQRRGFASSPSPKRFVPIVDAGHMSFTDVCNVARDRGGLLSAAHAAGVTMTGFLATLADHGCTQIKLPPAQAWPQILAATTAALESLTCQGTVLTL